VHHQRVYPGEHPSYGKDSELGVIPNGEWLSRRGKFIALFVLLTLFTALAGYEDRVTHSSAWADRWFGLFWLSMAVLVFSALLSIPRIAHSRAVVRRN
jgi:branched-subunit amino acid permease